MILLSSSPYLGHLITTEVVVWGICIGAMLAFTVYFYQQHILGALVRKIIDNAVGEENAKTLSELGKDNAFYRHSLRDTALIRKLISVQSASAKTDTEGEYDFAVTRFYIDEEKLELAKKRYIRDTKVWMYILGLVACVAVGAVMHFALPAILGFLPEA